MLQIVISFLLIASILVTPSAHAKPVAGMSDGNVAILLYDELCMLTTQVANLPRRATWTENDTTVEGCWGIVFNHEYISFYFVDKTVIGIPVRNFASVQLF